MSESVWFYGAPAGSTFLKYRRWDNANQVNSAFHRSWVNKWAVICVVTCTARVETIKWQTRAARGNAVAIWSYVKDQDRGLGLQPTGCTPVLSETQSAAAAAVCGLWQIIHRQTNLWLVRLLDDSWTNQLTTANFLNCLYRNFLRQVFRQHISASWL